MNNPFDKLRKQLEEQDWPSVYFFKFICPSDPETVAKVTSLFDDQSNIAMRPSKNGNYMSISSKEVMMSAADVIAIYEESAKIKGVISL
jgi:putative lipoic acid-binding regulatory protein